MHSVICSGLGSLECLVIIKCTKFRQLILRKIIKIIATRCQILRLKCTNSISAAAPPQTPLGELTALSQTPSWIYGPTSKGRGRGEGGKGKGEEKGKGREGKGEGRGKRCLCSDFTI